jgi:hypothetical protein
MLLFTLITSFHLRLSKLKKQFPCQHRLKAEDRLKAEVSFKVLFFFSL